MWHFLHRLSRRVSARSVSLPVLLIAFLAGITFWGGFNWSMEMTNTERFCVSCHEMRDNVFPEFQKTVHYSNRTGVRASCPDCHVPKDWGHKVIRKVQATNELYHWLAGTVNTREKFQAARMGLAQSVWANMKASDSRECRNCHNAASMKPDAQKPAAAQMHELANGWGMTCIECHQGIAHQVPRDFDLEAVMDDVHDRIDREKIDCELCHEDVSKSKKGSGWY